MKKLLESELVAGIEEVIAGAKEAGIEPAPEIVARLRGLQDAGGLKICQAVPKEDLAYKEV